MGDNYNFRLWVAAIILALFLFFLSDEGRRPMSDRMWKSVLMCCTIAFIFLVYPYVRDNMVAMWKGAQWPLRASMLWPLIVFGVTGSAIAGLTWLATYSHVTASDENTRLTEESSDLNRLLQDRDANITELRVLVGKVTTERDNLKNQETSYAQNVATKQGRINELNDSNNALSKERDNAIADLSKRDEKFAALTVANKSLSERLEPLQTNARIIDAITAKLNMAGGPNPLQKAALEIWIETFEGLSHTQISTDKARDEWLANVEVQKKSARASLIKFFGRSVIDGRFFDPKYKPTVGKRFDNRYDDDHNQKLNEIAVIVEQLEKEWDAVTFPKRSDQSAWLTVKQPEFNPLADNTVNRIAVPVENIGKVPGTVNRQQVLLVPCPARHSKMGVSYNPQIEIEKLRSEVLKGHWSLDINYVVPQGQTINLEVPLLRRALDEQDKTNKQIRYYLIGGFSYSDGADGIGATTFGFVYDPSTKTWQKDTGHTYNDMR